MAANQITAQNIRKIILQQSKRAGVGHVGSSLSIADIIAALYGSVLNIPSPKHPDRDRFVLSKGHAALAFYAAIYLKQWISEDVLNSYCTDNTYLGVHAEKPLTGVDFSSGSLGMGISYATGAALAGHLQSSTRRVFVLASDAECNEGITWEAAMFAAHHKLSNLYLLIDLNGQQALGYTRDILNLAPLSQKWKSFAWDVLEVDGHNQDEIIDTIDTCKKNENQPHVIIAHTTFGKGVSFMENQVKWHYWPMSETEYHEALQEITQPIQRKNA